jgi:hypothetical protein
MKNSMTPAQRLGRNALAKKRRSLLAWGGLKDYRFL